MKFAFISTVNTAPWGGSEELWAQAAIRLSKEGHEVHASVHGWPYIHPRITEIQNEMVKVHFRNPVMPSMTGRIWRKLSGKQYRDINMLRDLEWLSLVRAELVCISGPCFWGIYWMELCHEIGMPYTTLIQHHDESGWPGDEWIDHINPLFKSSRCNFFVSLGNKRVLEMQLAQELDNCKIVRNPCKVSRNVQITWPEESDSFNLACVARLEPVNKGQDILFQVLSLPQWRNRNLTLTLYGEGGNARSLKRLAEMLDVRNVVFSGLTEDIELMWRRHHGLILPSRNEGLPLAIVEAMFCARLCIVTDVADNAAFLENGVNGFIAEAPVVRCLERTIEEAWQSKDRWQAMGLNARQTILDQFPKNPVKDFCEELLDCANTL